jgi:hypothetical protein
MEGFVVLSTTEAQDEWWPLVETTSDLHPLSEWGKGGFGNAAVPWPFAGGPSTRRGIKLHLWRDPGIRSSEPELEQPRHAGSIPEDGLGEPVREPGAGGSIGNGSNFALSGEQSPARGVHPIIFGASRGR